MTATVVDTQVDDVLFALFGILFEAQTFSRVGCRHEGLAPRRLVDDGQRATHC